MQAQSLALEAEGTIFYTIFENGDRIPDFSYCGYMASETPLPFVKAVIKVPALQGDATLRIQAAIDRVSSLPVNDQGFRGAVLLEKRVHEVGGTLFIRASGIVLRGEGSYEEGTLLKATGTDRSPLIRILGENDCQLEEAIPVKNEYIPVNTTVLPLSQGHGLQPGDRIFITRPSTPEWLAAIGADRIGAYVDYPLTHWEPGDFDLRWDRTVREVTDTSVTLDAPLTCSLDPHYGGGYINRYTWLGRISRVAVENLFALSTYDKNYPKDEEHRWMAITVEHAEEGWIRRVTAKNFVSSAVALWENTRAFTIEECKSLEPVGEIGAHRRYAFHTTGQQHLFQRCYAEYGWHDFSVGFSAAGPNAFV
ncbi:MAG: hypothetical protein LUE93_00065 [Bacteroides sp.]|nr:hypothetical protein [Bacteroides sp.]